MKTLTYQDMMFVSGGKDDVSEPPPKTEVSAGPTEEDVVVAFSRCAAAVWAARKSPTPRVTGLAIEICVDAAMKASQFLEKKARPKGR